MADWIKPAGVIALAASLNALTGCGRQQEFTTARHGRYVGVGIYSPGELWSKLAGADQANASAAARTTDDDQIIVVVDSETGEVRQCGNLSGYCVGMNPWSKPLGTAQSAPLALTAHAAPRPAQGSGSLAR